MEIHKSQFIDVSQSILCVAKAVRDALLMGDSASEEQLQILETYKKEFLWANQLLFDAQGITQHPTLTKPCLMLVK